MRKITLLILGQFLCFIFLPVLWNASDKPVNNLEALINDFQNNGFVVVPNQKWIYDIHNKKDIVWSYELLLKEFPSLKGTQYIPDYYNQGPYKTTTSISRYTTTGKLTVDHLKNLEIYWWVAWYKYWFASNGLLYRYKFQKPKDDSRYTYKKWSIYLELEFFYWDLKFSIKWLLTDKIKDTLKIYLKHYHNFNNENVVNLEWFENWFFINDGTIRWYNEGESISILQRDTFSDSFEIFAKEAFQDIESTGYILYFNILGDKIPYTYWEEWDYMNYKVFSKYNANLFTTTQKLDWYLIRWKKLDKLSIKDLLIKMRSIDM